MRNLAAKARVDSGDMSNDDVRAWVRDYYGRELSGSADLKTNACCAAGAPPAYLRALLGNVHDDVSARFYGCGFPIPEGIVGKTVVDLGCGTGRDVYLLAQLAGETGHVHGVDMTAEQLEVASSTARWHAERFGFGKPNVSFHQGYIEDLRALPIDAGSVDVVVSNCVVNLSPRKDLVLDETARVLRDGGEMYFSDVFADRRLPEDVARDPLLYSECLGGALYLPDFLAMARTRGFPDPRVVSIAPIEIRNDDIAAKIGAARFYSVTLRLFKLPLEERCEDYGQLATYRGTLPHVGALFTLDENHVFEARRPERVCGNTADMLAATRFADHFDVVGDKSEHFGAFDCSGTMASTLYGQARTTGAPSPTSNANTSAGTCC